jgi:hypothetical protein
MAVPKVNKVCGCTDLDTGAYFIAITQIVIGLLTIASMDIATYLSVISGLVVAIAGGCLLFAAITKNRVGSGFYLILTLIGIIVLAITAVRVIIWNLEHDNFGGMVTLTVILYFLWMAVLIYFWICGYSFYARCRN